MGQKLYSQHTLLVIYTSFFMFDKFIIRKNMFLNLNNPHQPRPHRLSKDFQKSDAFPSQISKAYFSSLSKYKNKSYSTSSLKEQFFNYKQKNHSLVNSRLNLNVKNQQNHSYLKQKMKNEVQQRQRFNNNRLLGNERQFKLNMQDFKKSYLNLDIKLNKCTMNRDYFKPMGQQRNLPYQYQEKYNNNNTNNSHNINNNTNLPLSSPESTHQSYHIYNQNARNQKLLLEVNSLREQFMITKMQNQELRKQRNIDLELIARQNQVIKEQEQLMEISQTKFKYLVSSNQNNLHKINLNTQNHLSEDTLVYSFRNQEEKKINNENNPRPLECSDCLRKKTEKKINLQFHQIKFQKLEEQKKLMRKEIHELVYQCERLKEGLKKTEEKYQKQLGHNERLVKMICQEEEQEAGENRGQNSHEKNKEKQREKQNKGEKGKLTTKKEFILNEKTEYGPISIKKQTEKFLMQRKNHNNFNIADNINVDSQHFDNNKLGHYKSAANLLRFSNQNSQSQSIMNQSSKSPKNLDWCESDNIKKYLKQINQQKIKEIDQIQNLLKY